MSSQKSTSRIAVLPSRRRGHVRVGAILDAAAAVFAARGFDLATMTEIAASSGTAIGSLYRFFPNKDLLADALFARYAEAVVGHINALLPKAATLSSDAIIGVLLDLFLHQRPDRDAAVLLAENRREGAASRMRLRAQIRERIAAVLEAAGVIPEQARSMAPMLIQAMKAVPVLISEGLESDAVVAEARWMLSGYLTSARQTRSEQLPGS